MEGGGDHLGGSVEGSETSWSTARAEHMKERFKIAHMRAAEVYAQLSYARRRQEEIQRAAGW